MCYIVFISHSLHWRYIKIALQEYVKNVYTGDIMHSLRGLTESPVVKSD